MSNAMSALNGQVAPGEVTIREAGLQGMITLRGDLSLSKLNSVCKKLTGYKMPEPGQALFAEGKGICWMSPDELLLLVPHSEVGLAVVAIDKALRGKHYLAENVSDARAMITVEGHFASEVIAKLAPVDLHPSVFGVGEFRRSRLGQAAAAFWMREPDVIEVICFRSTAEYVFGLLAASAKDGPVGHF